MEKLFRKKRLSRRTITPRIVMWTWEERFDGFVIKVDYEQRKVWCSVSGNDLARINRILEELGTGILLRFYANIGMRNRLISVHYLGPPAPILAVVQSNHFFRVRPYITEDAPPDSAQFQPSEETRRAFLVRKNPSALAFTPGWKLNRILRRTPPQNDSPTIDAMVNVFRMKGVPIENAPPSLFTRPVNAPFKEDMGLEDLTFQGAKLEDGALIVPMNGTFYKIRKQPGVGMFTFEDNDVDGGELLLHVILMVGVFYEMPPGFPQIFEFFSNRLSLNVIPTRRRDVEKYWITDRSISTFFLWVSSVKAQAERENIEDFAAEKLRPLISDVAKNAAADLVFDPREWFFS